MSLAPAHAARAAYDANRVWRDFPILAREVHGKPLVFLDSAASSQRPQSVIDAVDITKSATTPTCIAVCTS